MGDLFHKKEYKKGEPLRNIWRGFNNFLNGGENLAREAFNGATGVTAQREANEANKELMQQQNQFNAEQAEITRNWNSIGEQMSRAQAAGVNPISVAMANGGANMGGDSQAQAAAAPTPQMMPETNQTAALNEAMASLMQSSASAFETAMLTGSKKALYDSQRQEVAANIDNLHINTQTQAALLPYTLAQAKADIYNTHAQTRLTKQQYNNLKQDYEQSQQRFENMFPIEFETALANREVSWLNVDKVTQEIANLEVTEEMLRSETYQNYAHSSWLESQTEGQDISNELEAEKIKYKEWLAQTYAETAAEELKGLSTRNNISAEDLAHYEKRFVMEKKGNRAQRFRDYSLGVGSIAKGVGDAIGSITKMAPRPRVGF